MKRDPSSRATAATTDDDRRLRELGEVALLGESLLLGEGDGTETEPNETFEQVVATSYSKQRESRAYRVVQIKVDDGCVYRLRELTQQAIKTKRVMQATYKVPERGFVLRASDVKAAKYGELVKTKRVGLWLAVALHKVPVDKLPPAAANALLRRHQITDRIDEALDLIFQWVDYDLKTRDGAGVDELLGHVDVGHFDEDLIVGLMSSTYPGKKLLRNREEFATRAAKRLIEIIGKDEAAKLIGNLR